MKVALDYDKTFTLDQPFWLGFVLACQDNGHDVRIVTVRDERHDRTAPLIELEKTIQVIYTRGVAKQWFCTHFTDGWMPDVWIDDNPTTIFNNSEFAPDGLAKWRAERGEPLATPDLVDWMRP